MLLYLRFVKKGLKMKPDSSGHVRISAKLQGQIANGDVDPQGCTHLTKIQDVVPSAEGCGKCLQMGDAWVNLRLCLICGHVGCCDNSKNTHATKHYHETHHPMIISFEPDEEWVWCYADEVTLSP
jgi:uncharacterized UBP type Zn finger protein